MRVMLAGVWVLALVCGACGTTAPTLDAGTLVVQTPTQELAARTRVPSTPEATVAPEPTSGVGEDAPGPKFDLGFGPASAAGLVTATGIPVAVLGELDGARVVRTPCGAIATVSGGDPLDQIDVVLDPGHGGPIDTGAVGPNGLVEANLNLQLADAALAELDRRNIAAATTRSADYLTTLQVRSAFADTLGAQLMVSIHHNAPNALASAFPGTEVFVQSDSPDSRRLGGLLQAHVKGALAQFDDVAWTTAADAGVLRVLNTEGGDAYGMIRRPATPTALVEFGYLSNSDEAALFATGEYIAVAAVALADAVEAYLTTTDPGSGFIAEPRVFDPARAPGAEVCQDPALE